MEDRFYYIQDSISNSAFVNKTFFLQSHLTVVQIQNHTSKNIEKLKLSYIIGPLDCLLKSLDGTLIPLKNIKL